VGGTGKGPDPALDCACVDALVAVATIALEFDEPAVEEEPDVAAAELVELDDELLPQPATVRASAITDSVKALQ
jgi:hypothetical protein